MSYFSSTRFYETHEKGTGWLHVLEINDGQKRIVIEDDTDIVTAYANTPIERKEIATIWLKHKMGTSAFVQTASYELSLSRLKSPPSTDGLEPIIQTTGVKLSYLAD